MFPTVYAQYSIKGKITDQTSKEALEYATIYLPQLEKGTYANVNGEFLIEDLPSGNYKIVFSNLGFETIAQTITIPYDANLDINLKPSAIEMEAVIISTPFHKLQSENVMKVEQKKVSDLKSKGAITLAEGISTIAGVEIISTGLSIGKPVIRGLSSNRVLVYTQGIRLENQQFGDEHGLGINDAGIASVEVIKGPASLLYGSDALGGVLYLNPERFAHNNSSSGSISTNYMTNTKGYNLSTAYKASGDRFKFLFRGTLVEHSDYKTEGFHVTNSRFRERDFKAGLGYQAVNFKTELRYNANVAKLGIPESIAEQSTNRTPLEPFQEISNQIFSSKSTVFLENSRIDINLGYLYNDRKEFEDHEHEGEEDEDEDEHDENEEAALQMKLKTFNYDLKYHLPRIGKIETIFGVQGMNQTNKNYGEETLIPDATTNDIGILGTSHIHFKKADIQLGLRYDHRSLDISSSNNKSFNSFNGAIGVKTNLFKKVTARLNLASGYRAPNLAELTSDGTHEGTNRYEIGNPDLTNEQNFQVDLALEFKNEHVEFFVNGFYNSINDYIFITPNGQFIDEEPVFLYEQDNAYLYGGEIGLHLHPHPLDWLHFESSFETVTGKQKNNNSYLPLIPANSLHNTIRVEFEKNVIRKGYAFIKYSSTFNQNNISAFETTTEGYSLLSTGFGCSINIFNDELSFYIAGNNLTDKTYINHLSRLKADNIPNIGRNFTVGFTYNL